MGVTTTGVDEVSLRPLFFSVVQTILTAWSECMRAPIRIPRKIPTFRFCTPLFTCGFAPKMFRKCFAGNFALKRRRAVAKHRQAVDFRPDTLIYVGKQGRYAMNFDIMQADAWDVHPEGRVILVLDPPYGLGKASWDMKADSRQWYSMAFLSSLVERADSAVVILYGLDDSLIPLAAEVIATGRPHWRFANLVDFVPDRPRQGMNQAIAYRLPRNSRALLLVYTSDPLVGGEDMVKETFPESMRPCLEFMRGMAERRGLTTRDLIRRTGCSTCSHYLNESEFLFPDEARFNEMFPDATDSERRAYREARRAYREARTPFRRPKISDGYVYHLDQNRDDTFGHPTAKQIGEIKPLLEVCPGWHIVDPFCGSGMTARAAYELGRGATLSDIDDHWVDVTRQRVAMMTQED